MDWSQVWPTLIASLAGVVAAAAFTWYFTYRTDQDRKRGVRALLSSEIQLNKTVLTTQRENLNRLMQEHDPMDAVVTFSAAAHIPQWQTARWNLPDVIVAVSPAELRGLTAWYFDLAQVTSTYDVLVGYVAHVERRTLDMQGAFDTMKLVVTAMDQAIRSTPPLLDPRL